MDITWLDPTEVGDRDVAGAVAVLEAARAVDAPHDLSETAASLLARLIHGWDGHPPIMAITRDDHGRIVGVLEVELPRWDNRHMGTVLVKVDPHCRRQGIGRRLFEAGVERLRADSRRVVLTYGNDRPETVGFARAIGVEQASMEVQRRLDLITLDWDRLDKEYAEAEPRADAYELVRLPTPIPDTMLSNVVAMTAAINDAPTDDLDIEDEVFSPERIRAFEAAQLGSNRRVYRLVARERSTGEFCGHTMLAVEADRPWFGWQFDTSVLRPHRGRRLGLLLKIGMLRWLRDEEPQLRTIDTWNAATNPHMIAVNEVLGYRVVAHEIAWQRHL